MFFLGERQEQSLELSIKMIRYVKLKAGEVGCKLAIYNHRGWFGKPHHQLIQLNDQSITMVYNFHPAHEYVEEFPEFGKKMKHKNLRG